MQAKDVMTTDVVTVSPDTPVRDIAALFLKHRISGVPVINGTGAILGMVSEGDLMHRPELGTDQQRRSWWLRMLRSHEEEARAYVKVHGVRAADVMTRYVVTVEEDASLADIANTLEHHHIKRAPVVHDDRLVGIVSRADLLRGMAARRPDTGGPTLTGDRAIRERFQNELADLGMASSPYIRVVVSDGVIHLWGLTESEDELRALRVVAEAVPGTRSVDMHVSAMPSSLLAE